MIVKYFVVTLVVVVRVLYKDLVVCLELVVDVVVLIIEEVFFDVDWVVVVEVVVDLVVVVKLVVVLVVVEVVEVRPVELIVADTGVVCVVKVAKYFSIKFQLLFYFTDDFLNAKRISRIVSYILCVIDPSIKSIIKGRWTISVWLATERVPLLTGSM